jgi:hypothetical protein
MAEADPVIRRVQRNALLWCAAATVAAVAWRPGDPAPAAGVVGGGLIGLISLFAIRGSIDAVLAVAVPRPAADASADAGAADAGPAPARAGSGIALKLAGRYGLLALAAYVMIARLRLHPVGLLIGASSLVAGASLEAVRTLRRP